MVMVIVRVIKDGEILTVRKEGCIRCVRRVFVCVCVCVCEEKGGGEEE
jgi:hypothetical protein